MRKEVIIRMQPGSEKHHKRALKVAADVRGVESITVAGRDRNLLLVIGDGVDESALTKKLRKEVGEAEIVELRTLAAGASGSGYLPATSTDVLAAAQSGSPRHWHSANTPGRDLPVGGRVSSYASPLANPGAARWPSEQYRQTEAGYYPHAPSPSYYHASPVAGNGGYGGSSYARAAARSHPANYSPMIERHDYHVAGSSHRHGGVREPKCCSIQ
uniref:Uncharacterized protein n=1 Tax=Avena sativa TaxID=4498 RepID=A0ACD5UCD3_AVESA